MKYFRIPNCVEKSAVQLLVIALIALNLGLNPAIAGETKGQLEGAGPKALSPVDASDFVLSAHPAVGKINQTRTIFLRFQPPGGCIRTYAFSLDTSLAESQRLILVRTQVKEGLCGVIPRPNPVRAEFERRPQRSNH